MIVQMFRDFLRHSLSKESLLKGQNLHKKMYIHENKDKNNCHGDPFVKSK